MGDLGLPGSVVQMTDAGAQKALWEVRKAGLNIMMSMKGDGKPVSFIEDCAVPLEHLADYVDRLTAVFRKHGTRGTWYAHASVGTLHVRPILDMRRDGAAKMRAIAEEASAMVREYKGAYSGEHGDGLVRSEWVAWQFGPRLTRAFEEIKDLFDPTGLMNPGKIVRGTRMDDATLFRFGPGYRPLAARHRARLVGVERAQRSGRPTPCRRRAPAATPRAASPRPSRCATTTATAASSTPARCARATASRRDEIHLTRGRANTLRLALSGQLGPEFASRRRARGARPVRQLQGLPPRLPDRRRHGEDEDRVQLPVAAGARDAAQGSRDRAPAAVGAVGGAVAVAREPARHAARRRAAVGESWCGLSARRSLPRCRRDTFLRVRMRERAGADAADVVLFVDTFSELLRAGECARRAARC